MEKSIRNRNKKQQSKKDKLLNKLNNDLNNSNTKIIINEIKETKDEVLEVKQVVNKAISKASSLIKYLMEHHPNTPL